MKSLQLEITQTPDIRETGRIVNDVVSQLFERNAETLANWQACGLMPRLNHQVSDADGVTRFTLVPAAHPVPSGITRCPGRSHPSGQRCERFRFHTGLCRYEDEAGHHAFGADLPPRVPGIAPQADRCARGDVSVCPHCGRTEATRRPVSDHRMPAAIRDEIEPSQGESHE